MWESFFSIVKGMDSIATVMSIIETVKRNNLGSKFSKPYEKAVSTKIRKRIKRLQKRVAKREIQNSV